MRLADAIGLRIGGKDAIEARLNGQVVWKTSPTSLEDTLNAYGGVAFWDFSEPQAPYLSKLGRGDFPLNNGTGSGVTTVADGPFGTAIALDGRTDYLSIPAAEVGDLNLGTKGDSCTVVAWVRRTTDTADFIAGMWREDDNDPKRQYGLFLDLPLYGGVNRVCGHVSKTGGASPGYPFSMDYSASARMVNSVKWRFVAFTYDGTKAISYLDGFADSYTDYTDPNGVTYDKNPYLFTDGLNNTSVADFTVGAVELTEGMDNHLAGRIGGIAILDRALTAAEIMSLHKRTLFGAELLIFDFHNQFDGLGEPAKSVGFKSFLGAAATDTTSNTDAINFSLISVSGNSYLYRSNSEVKYPNTPGVTFIDTIENVDISECSKITFEMNNASEADLVQLVIKVSGSFYVTNEVFTVTGNGRTGGNWTTSEVKEVIIDETPGKWRELTLVEGATLSVGAVTSNSITSGALEGIGFYCAATPGLMRIRNLNVVSL